MESRLITINDRHPYPTLRSGVGPSDQLKGHEKLPLLWLSLFDASDLIGCTVSRGGKSVVTDGYVAPRIWAQERLERRQGAFSRVLPSLHQLDQNMRLLGSFLENRRRNYVSLELPSALHRGRYRDLINRIFELLDDPDVELAKDEQRVAESGIPPESSLAGQIKYVRRWHSGVSIPEARELLRHHGNPQRVCAFLEDRDASLSTSRPYAIHSDRYVSVAELFWRISGIDLEQGATPEQLLGQVPRADAVPRTRPKRRAPTPPSIDFDPSLVDDVDAELWRIMRRPRLSAADREMVRRLLNHGANPNYKRSPTDPSPLHDAMFAKDSELVEILLSAGADPNECGNRDRWPPLVHVWNREVAERCIEAGANVDLEDRQGLTPVHQAMLLEDDEELETFRILYERSETPGKRQKYLTAAVENGRRAVQAYLETLDD